MRKEVASGLAAVTLVAATLAVAPSARAQAGDRIVTPGIQLPMLQAAGSAIGVSVREVRTEELSSLTLPPGGVIVEEVRPESPASAAGLRAGDIIVDFDGERVRGVRHFSRLVLETPAGRTVTSTIIREGERHTVEITPEASERLADILPRVERRIERGLRALPRDFELDVPALRPRSRLGVTLFALGDQLASYFGVEGGALVSAVEADSPVAQAGVRAGDIITSIGGRMVDDPEDVAAGVRAAEPGAAIEIRLMRDRQLVVVTATLPDQEASAGGRARI